MILKKSFRLGLKVKIFIFAKLISIYTKMLITKQQLCLLWRNICFPLL